MNPEDPYVNQVEPSFVYDRLSRPLRDLRISLTDRCNFRCTYCMPKEVFGPDFAFLPHQDVLTNDEIVRLAALFARFGVTKIRLTGGEPLLRHNLEALVSALSHIPGITDIALTTNGSLLTTEKARRLKAAGLRRISISLDALDHDIFTAMNDVHFPVSKVLRAIETALDAGFEPVKVNMVVKRGVNDQQVLRMAENFRGTGCVLRFIEFMDVGNSNQWKLDQVVPAADIVAAIHAKWPLEPVKKGYSGEVADRYRYLDGQGEIGVISSVTRAFCGTCTRARLTPEGRFFTCLFGSDGFDLRTLLRTGCTDEDILNAIRRVWTGRSDRYSELRSERTSQNGNRVEMFRIGG